MMPIATDPISTGSSQAPAGPSKELGRDAFLNLLIAQLQNQDPLNPTDSTEFTAQLAQFSSLEQLGNVNDNIKLLQNFQASGNHSQAVALIGKEISASGNSLELAQNQPAGCDFKLDGNASVVTVSIYDHTSGFVNSFEGRNLTAGKHTLYWDGIDKNGSPAPAGNYTFEILAADAGGETVNTSTFFSGRVNKVIFESDTTYLVSGDQKVALGDVIEISAVENTEKN